MKNYILLSLITAASLFAVDEAKKEAKSIEDVFKLADVKGQIRAVYQTNSNDGAGNSAKDFLIGGKLSMETAPFAGVSLGASFYTSQPLSSNKNFKDLDYYTADTKGYAMLGESFIKYTFAKGDIKLGRMELDTPLVNSDDIRMVPDLYTAAMIGYSPIDKLKITVGVVTQVAGWENSSADTKFEKMGKVISLAMSDGGTWDNFFATNQSAQDSKLYLAGVTFERDNYMLQGWFSRQTDILDTYYLAGSFKPIDSEAISTNIIAQYMNEKSIGGLSTYASTNPSTKIDSDIYGLAVEVESKTTGLKGSFAYNKSGKKLGILNDGGTAGFFGGGKDPLLTSMDVVTANGAGDITAYKYKIDYDFGKVGIDGLSITAAHGNFDQGVTKITQKESDLIVAYAINEKLNLETVLTKIEDSTTSDNDRLRVFVKYDF